MITATTGAQHIPPGFRRVAAWSWRILVVAAVAALALYLLSRLVLVWMPLVGALLVATVLYPLAGRLRRRGWPRLLSAWAVFLAAFVVLGGIVTGLVVRSMDELDNLDLNVRRGVNDVEAWLVDGPLGLSPGRLDQLEAQARQVLETGGGAISGGVIGGTMMALELLTGVLIAIVLLFFVLKDGDRMWAWVAGGFGERHRERIDEVGRRAWTVLGRYVRGTAIVGVVDAVLIAVVLIVLGVPLVIPLAVLTFAGAFFPLIGAVTAGAVAALVTLATQGFVSAAIVTGAIIAIQQVEGDVLAPVVLGRSVRLHPAVILLAVTAGATLGGIIGAFLAVPVAALAVSVGTYLKSLPGPGGRPPAKDGRRRETATAVRVRAP